MIYLHVTSSVYPLWLFVVLVFETSRMTTLMDGKELVILLFLCVFEKNILLCFVMFFPFGVYIGTLNLIASIPCPACLYCIHIFKITVMEH